MHSRLGIRDLRNRVDWALRQLEESSRHKVPIDLDRLSSALGISVEWRWMVPEGVMVPRPDGIHIYLQSNFNPDGTVKRRQRFTFAHEICHALFYDSIRDRPRPLPGTPSGAALEKLCQQGAGYLLVPSAALSLYRKRQGAICSVADIRTLGETFDVSTDVLLKRVHEEDAALENEYGLFLLRSRAGDVCFDSAACGLSLRALNLMPDAGEPFERWLVAKLGKVHQTSATSWSKDIGDRRLIVRRIRRSASSEFVELKIELVMKHSAHALQSADQKLFT
jgi:hypothetical protein